MNWSTVYVLLKNMIGATKEELEQEITEKLGLRNQFLDELPEVGESGVLYFIPKDDVDPSAEDQYFMYVWDPDNTEFVLLDPDMDMSPYAKTADLATVATTGAYSDLSGTPDLTPYITEEEADEKYMSGDVLDDETVTGNPVSFESLDGGHAKSCEVTFSPIQSGQGDPSPTNIRPISGWDGVTMYQGLGADLRSGKISSCGMQATGGLGPSETTDVIYCPCSQGKKYVLLGIDLGISLVHAFYSSEPARNMYAYNNTRYEGKVATAPIDGWLAYRIKKGTNQKYSIREYYDTHAATFSDTVYGGVWKANEGKTIIEWADKILLSSLTWQKYTDSSVYYGTIYFTDSLQSLLADTTDVNKIYTCFENFNSVTNYGHDGPAGAAKELPDNSSRVNRTKRVYVRCESAQTLEDFETLITGKYLSYIKTTPTEITLTTEQIELLKGNNTISTDGDTIKLTAAQLEIVKLPAVTSSDEGKVLMVNDQGEWVADDIPDGTNTQY